MQQKPTTQLPKTRFLQEVPRHVYMNSPELKNNDEKSRRSFISLLRKGPSKQEREQKHTPRQISLNCAVWLHNNNTFQQPVSLYLQYKDASGEQYILVETANPMESHSAMLSGTVTIHLKGPVEFINACCSGVPESQHIHIEELHVKKAAPSSNMKLVANA